MFIPTSLLSPPSPVGSKAGPSLRSDIHVENPAATAARYNKPMSRKDNVNDDMITDKTSQPALASDHPYMNACIPVIQSQLGWVTYINTLHILEPQRVMQTARMSELGSTMTNLRAYMAHAGVDMRLPYQQLPNPHAVAALQPKKLHHSPPSRSDQMASEKVLGKRKPLSLLTSASPSNIELAKKGGSPKRVKVQTPAETVRVSGGLDREKDGIQAAFQRSVSGECVKTRQPELAKRTATPCPRVLPPRPAETKPVERNSPNANRKSLARPQPKLNTSTGRDTGTGGKAPQKDSWPHTHVRNPITHVRVSSPGQVQGRASARPLPTITPTSLRSLPVVGFNHPAPRVDKLKLLRLSNEINRCIYLCEHGMGSSKIEELLLNTLDQITTVSYNPELTLQMIADVKLGIELRKLLTDDRYGQRVKGNAQAIMNLWKRSLRTDRRCIKSRSTVRETNQSMDPQRPTK